MGDFDSISAFKVLGLDTYPVSEKEQAEDTLKQLIVRVSLVLY